MKTKKAIKTIRKLTHHNTYGDLFSLIEEIRRGQLAGKVPRIGQMGALFQLNCRVLGITEDSSDGK